MLRWHSPIRRCSRNIRDTREVMRFAFSGGGPDVQAQLSVVDVSGILSNVANKFLLEGFFSVERVWRNICAVRNVNDFKTVTSYRLIGKDQYEEIDWLGKGQARGKNFGWRVFEGRSRFAEGSAPGAVAPVLTLRHADGYCSVVLNRPANAGCSSRLR